MGQKEDRMSANKSIIPGQRPEVSSPFELATGEARFRARRRPIAPRERRHGTPGRIRWAFGACRWGMRIPCPDSLPDAYVMGAFEAQAVACRELVAAKRRENRTLAATRPGLLPKLLSGDFRVADPERIAREAV